MYWFLSDANSNLDKVVSDPAETSYMSNNYVENEDEESFDESEQTRSDVAGKQKVSNNGIIIKPH